MLKERVREIATGISEKVFPLSMDPSPEYSAFIASIRSGEDPDIPTFGIRGILDYYGRNRRTGEEKGRYRIPMERLERSYHITRTAEGQFRVVDEGLFPHDGK